MKRESRILLLTGAYLLMLLVMFILPFRMPGYSIVINTVDDLGAQAAPYAWMMNFTFIFLAAASLVAGWPYFEGHIFHRSILVFSVISLVLSAVLNHAPLDPHISNNVTESGLHEYFSCSAVFSFAILCIATCIILERRLNKLLAAGSGLSAIILLILTAESNHLAGIWSRLLLIIAFGWMIYCFKINEF